MKNENHLQLSLYKSGLKALGTEALDGRSDVEIRRAGAKRLAAGAAIGLSALAGVVGTEAMLVYGINHSPSTVYQDHLQQESNQPQASLPQPADITPVTPEGPAR